MTARTTPLRVLWNHPTLLGAVDCSIRGPSSIGGPPLSTPLLGAFHVWSASFRGPRSRDVSWGPWSRGPLPPLPLQQGHARRRFPEGTGPPRTFPVNVPLTRCRGGRNPLRGSVCPHLLSRGGPQRGPFFNIGVGVVPQLSPDRGVGMVRRRVYHPLRCEPSGSERLLSRRSHLQPRYLRLPPSAFGGGLSGPGVVVLRRGVSRPWLP